MHTEHANAGGRLAVRGAGEGFAKCIARRGHNVAEHHTDTSQRQCPKASRDRPVVGFGGCDANDHMTEKRSIGGFDPASYRPCTKYVKTSSLKPFRF